MPQHSILIVTNRVPYPLNDGGNMAMYSMVEGYHKAGWDVFLFSMNTSRHFVATESLPELFQKIQFETFDINTDVRFMPTVKNFMLSKKPNHAERFFSKQFGDKLSEIITSFKPSIVQLESIYLATYLPGIRAAADATIAIRLHNIEYQIWERLAEETGGIKKFYLRDLAARIKRFELDAWRAADVLIAITNTDADVVSASVKDTHVIVVPFGFDTSAFPETINDEDWNAYHIGAMDWVPNAEAVTWFLDEVWDDVHKELPEFEFFFAGRNMPYSFQKYTKNGVHCMGEVADAKEFAKDKKILVVPLRSGGGIRIKVVEAMAMGKLVISTTVGIQGIDGVLPGTHYLLADTPDEFKQQIVWAVQHKEQAAAIAQKGAAVIREVYNQANIIHHLTGSLGELVDN